MPRAPRRRHVLPSLLAIAVAVGAQAQTVHVVGPGGFAQITQAIAAAANGDVVLVRSGTYTPFTLAKDLTVTADAGAVVDIVGTPFFGAAPTLLQPPTFAKIAGLRFRVGSPLLGYAETRVLAGTVHFADCLFEGWRSPGPTSALSVQNAHAALQRCNVIAYGTGSGGGAGCHAMEVRHATVAAVDCTFLGGNLNWDYSPGNGGHGVLVDDATVRLSACYALGGTNASIVVSGVAGDGVRIVTPSQVSVADCDLRGGSVYGSVPGGSGLTNLALPAARHARTLFTGGGAPPGPPVTGAIVAAPLLGSIGTPAIVLGTPWSIDHRANPSTSVLAVWSDRLGPSGLPELSEPAWLAGAIDVAAIGVTDAVGRLVLTFTVPTTPALMHQSFFVQGVAGLALPLEVAPPIGGAVR